MKRISKKIFSGAMLLALALPLSAMADEQALQQKIDELQKKVDKIEEKSLGRWLTIGGDYRFRVDSLYGRVAEHASIFDPALQQWLPGFMAGTPAGPMPRVAEHDIKNDTLFTNRFGLNLKAKATQDVSVTARLLMYKTAGSQDATATTGTLFADRVGGFDGTLGHVPTDGKLLVDQAFATWSNIADQPIWFSVGRRPSTNGVPSHLRQNNEKPGNGGTPSLLVDYAFDGMTLGWAPDIDALPGAYAKFCYGRGFENGVTRSGGNSLNDTDMVGIAIVPVDTDPLRISFQWNRGINIFDFPVMANTTFSGPLFANGAPITTDGGPVKPDGSNIAMFPMSTKPAINLGDIDWYELGALSTLKNVGMGSLNLFGTFGLSVTHPNGEVSPTLAAFGFQNGLMTGGFASPEKADDKTGWAAYIGARYDIESTGTKIGAEYNHGSKNWITFAPAADDMWTSKVGTRGNVYEGYLIQELKLKPISSYVSKAFFRLGYQYYDFEYTGSNNWVGAPEKISDLKTGNVQFLTPLKSAQNVYATFEVKF